MYGKFASSTDVGKWSDLSLCLSKGFYKCQVSHLGSYI